MKAITLSLIYALSLACACAQAQGNQSDLDFIMNRAFSADFDADGIPDVVVTDFASGHFAVGFGERGGGFTWREPTPIPNAAGGGTPIKPILFTKEIDSNSTPMIAFAGFASNRVAIFSGARTRADALRAPVEVAVQAGPLGLAASNLDTNTPELELVVPLVARAQPQTSMLLPRVGWQAAPISNGDIDPALASTMTGFALLKPSSQGTRNHDHVGNFNFKVEIDGVASSRLRISRLGGRREIVDTTFVSPYGHMLSADMGGANEPGQIILYEPGLDSFAIATVSESTGNPIAIEELVIQHEGIDFIENIGGAGGIERLAVVHDNRRQITVFGWDYVNKQIVEGQSVNAPAGSPFGTIGGAIGSIGGGIFLGHDDGSYSTYEFDASGNLQLASQGALPAFPLLAPHATVMLYTDDPLGGNAFEFESFVAGQWSIDALLSGGQIDATREIFQGTSAGLGDPQPVQLTPLGNAGASARAQANQFGDASSSVFLAGDVIVDGNAAVVITPPAGNYDAPIHLNFIPAEAGATITYRVNGQAWAQAPAGGFFIAAHSLVEFYGQSLGGQISAIQSALYHIDLPFGLDSNGDLLPDNAAVAFGFDPFGNGDADGDGVSDVNELFNGSDPFSAASVPASINVKFPPALEYDVLVNVPLASGGTTDGPVAAATFTMFTTDGTPIRADVEVANGIGTVQSDSWYADFNASQATNATEFFGAHISSVSFPALDAQSAETVGAAMFGMAFPPNIPLPQLPPPPAGSIPVAYPNNAQLAQWVDDTTAVIIGGFKKIQGMDSESEVVEINADTTLAVAAFTAWADRRLAELGRVKVKYPWLPGGKAGTPFNRADMAMLQEPQAPEMVAHDLTHLVQQMHQTIVDEPAYRDLRIMARQMIFLMGDPDRPLVVGAVPNSGKALIEFFLTGVIPNYYSRVITPDRANLERLRAQLVASPEARDVVALSGSLQQLPDGSWAIASDGENHRLFSPARSTAVAEGGAVTIELLPLELHSAIPGTLMRVVGFPISPSPTDIEVFSLQLQGVDLTTGVVDTDLDNLADAFEFYFFGHLNSTFWQDSDGDGFADGEEYASGTDPTDPASFPAGAPAYPNDVFVTFDGDEFVITWTGSPTALYGIEIGDLSNWALSTEAPVQIAPGTYEWRAPVTIRDYFRITVSFP